MAAGLAKILRTSISKRQFIYLKEELELVNCYVDIQKIRFNDKFLYAVDLQEGLEECVIPQADHTAHRGELGTTRIKGE